MKDMTVHLRDMLEYGEEAGIIAQKQGEDKARQLAIERCLEVMGEAAKRIPRELQPQWSDIPWEDIIDLRNAISHEYEIFSIVELERIALHDVPPVLDIIRNILARFEE